MAHLPDWSAFALIVAVIHTPVKVESVSPEVKLPVYSVQPATGLLMPAAIRRW